MIVITLHPIHTASWQVESPFPASPITPRTLILSRNIPLVISCLSHIFFIIACERATTNDRYERNAGSGMGWKKYLSILQERKTKCNFLFIRTNSSLPGLGWGPHVSPSALPVRPCFKHLVQNTSDSFTSDLEKGNANSQS